MWQVTRRAWCDGQGAGRGWKLCLQARSLWQGSPEVRKGMVFWVWWPPHGWNALVLGAGSLSLPLSSTPPSRPLRTARPGTYSPGAMTPCPDGEPLPAGCPCVTRGSGRAALHVHARCLPAHVAHSCVPPLPGSLLTPQPSCLHLQVGSASPASCTLQGLGWPSWAPGFEWFVYLKPSLPYVLVWTHFSCVCLVWSFLFLWSFPIFFLLLLCRSSCFG